MTKNTRLETFLLTHGKIEQIEIDRQNDLRKRNHLITQALEKGFNTQSNIPASLEDAENIRTAIRNAAARRGIGVRTTFDPVKEIVTIYTSPYKFRNHAVIGVFCPKLKLDSPGDWPPYVGGEKAMKVELTRRAALSATT